METNHTPAAKFSFKQYVEWMDPRREPYIGFFLFPRALAEFLALW
jgi:hypothetical protein